MFQITVDDLAGTSCPRCLRNGRAERIFHGFHGHAAHGCLCKTCTKGYFLETGIRIEPAKTSYKKGQACDCPVCKESRDKHRKQEGGHAEHKESLDQQKSDALEFLDWEEASKWAEKSVEVKSSWAQSVLKAGIAGSPSITIQTKGYFVYLLWGKEGSLIPIYVGQSRNIMGRLGDHLRDPQKRDLVTGNRPGSPRL